MFDQDPNDEAHISGADFAAMCDEMKELRAQLEAVTAERDKLQAALDGMEPIAWIRQHPDGALTYEILHDEEMGTYEKNIRCMETALPQAGGAEMLRHQYLVERINNRKPSRMGDYLFAVVLIAWCAYWWIAALLGAHF